MGAGRGVAEIINKILIYAFTYMYMYMYFNTTVCCVCVCIYTPLLTTTVG